MEHNINIQKIRAVIFDMDGLMIDTERIAWETFCTACSAYGYTPDFKIYVESIGTTMQQTREIIINGYGGDFPYDQINSSWVKEYYRRINSRPLPCKKGLPALLKLLTGAKLRLCVATSTKRKFTLIQLSNSDLLPYFPLAVCGDEVENGKPHPEIYLKAARLLHTPPEFCLVLEDSDPGVRAALAAGMTVIQIPDMKAPAAAVRQLGHSILDSLEDVAALFGDYAPAQDKP